MTEKKILERLMKIAKKDGSFRDPFICSDLVSQDNLFEIQNMLAELMLEVAKSSGDEERLVRAFPYIYKRG